MIVLFADSDSPPLRRPPPASHSNKSSPAVVASAAESSHIIDVPELVTEPAPSAHAKKRRVKKKAKATEADTDAAAAAPVRATIGSLTASASEADVKNRKKKSKKLKSTYNSLIGEHAWFEESDGRGWAGVVATDADAVASDGQAAAPATPISTERDGEVNPKMHKLLRDINGAQDPVRFCLCFCACAFVCMVYVPVQWSASEESLLLTPKSPLLMHGLWF